MLRGLGLAILLTATVAFAADFLGPEACKACHPAAYQIWKQGKHARAMEALTPAQQKDARCLSCHAPDQAEQHVTAITCETCHGGGQYYSASYVMKDPELSRLVGLQDPSEKTCKTCHDASSPSLKPFDFTEKLKLIDHKTAEKAAREPKPAPTAKK